MAGNWAVSSYTDGFSPETKQNLHHLYAGCCSICGQKRESPFGHIEADAAHIHPAQHSGPDRESNGLLLCKRCHWGFDSGWFSLTDSRRILVADAPAVAGAQTYQQFDGEPLCEPQVDDLAPAPRFIQIHRKLTGFDSLIEGDRLTIGGLHNSETRLIDGRRVIIDGAIPEALVVNCCVTSVNAHQVHCEHELTLKQRLPETSPVSRRSKYVLDPDSFSFEMLETYVTEADHDYEGVEKKWEWGRLFRAARTKYGLSHAEIAERLTLRGTSKSQVERSEAIYDAFPDREFVEDGPSFGALAELVRQFEGDDLRAAYECIVATGCDFSVNDTRSWIELLLADKTVTTEAVKQSLRTHTQLSEASISTHTRRILDVHDTYESRFGSD